MSISFKKIIAAALLFTNIFQTVAAAVTPMMNYQNPNTAMARGAPQTPYNPYNSTNPVAPPANLMLTTNQFGITGPLSAGVNYSSLTNGFLNVQFLKAISELVGVNLLGEYGENQYRLNGTIGFFLSPTSLLKFTAEQFSQKLPFVFDSGTVNKRAHQVAIGGRFQHFLGGILDNFSVGAYGARSGNINLDPVRFISNQTNCGGFGAGLNCVNERHIAGADIGGGDLGLGTYLGRRTYVEGRAFYDSVKYNTIYSQYSFYNKNGFGGGVYAQHLLASNLKFSASAEMRKIYDTYNVSLSWLPRISGVPTEFALTGQHVTSRNQTPDNNTVGVQVTVFADRPNYVAPAYTFTNVPVINDITSWVSKPAVKMNQVLVIAEQWTHLDSPVIGSVSPSFGPLAGGNTLIISGNNFLPGSTVLIGGNVAQILAISPTAITVVVPPSNTSGSVDVTVVSPDGQHIVSPGAYLYTDTPPLPTVSNMIPSSVASTGGTVVTITGTGFITNQITIMVDGVLINPISVTPTSIEFAAPPHAPGNAPVAVITLGGTVPVPGGLTYYNASLAVISGVTPNTGETTGGTVVTINGSNLAETTSILVDGIPVSTFSVISDNLVTLTMPPHSAGTVNISVITPAGTTTANGAFTYYAIPTISTVIPNSGSVVGGTSVTINGTNLSSTTAVSIGNTPVTSFSVVSDTQLAVITPAHAQGLVDIQITTEGGTATATGAYTYTAQANPIISSVSPNSGSTIGGNTVTILGSGFTGTTGIDFGSTPVSSFTIISDSQLTVTVPVAMGPGLVDITITTPVGNITATNAYTYVTTPAPLISTVTPNNGSTAGGTLVSITGTGFTGATSVTIGGTIVSSVTVVSDSQVQFTTPLHAAGLVDVTVTTPAGAGTATNAFSYVQADLPTVTGVFPNNGSVNGGTTVTLTGNNFTGTTSILLDGVAATSINILSNTQLTFVTPAHAAGLVGIDITNASGTTTINNAYTYVAATLPTITNVVPNSGSANGGAVSIINGSNFTGTTAVTFGGTPVTSFIIINDTQLSVTTPAHLAGLVDVVVTTPQGTTTSTNAYTYIGVPAISSLTPNTGNTNGGTVVVISGSNLAGTTAVSFGGNAAPISAVTANSVTVIAPAHAAGSVDVVLTTPGGVATATGAFTYLSPAIINSLSPFTGSSAGGTVVVIQGSNLNGTTNVTFDGVGATITNVTPTAVTVQTPGHAAGTVNVVLTTPSSTATLNNAYTYVDSATISSLKPNQGNTGGGTAVTILGTNFTGATGVTFGNISGTALTVVSDSELIVYTPAHGPGPVDVAITTPGGTVTGASLYTYIQPAVVTTISPNTGSTQGGTLVSLTGSNFTGVTAINFDGVAGTSLQFIDDAHITIRTPAHVEGAVDLQILTTGGSTIVTNAFTYLAPATITLVAPNTGSSVGGTSVVISGTGFAGTSAVLFGTTPATITNVTSSSVTVTTQAHAAGTVDVTVTTPAGPTVLSNAYTYQDPAILTSITPDNGSSLGGQTVTITGSGFIGTTQVTFGTTPVTSFVVGSDTTMTVVTPAHAVGVVSVSITTPAGTTTQANAYTYVAPAAATITSINPNSGSVAGGDTVTITGTNLAGASTVTFDTTSVAIQSATSTTVTVVTPAHASGLVNVSVTTPAGTTTSSDAYNYVNLGLPIINSVLPNSGNITGGDAVTISGSNLLGTTAVAFGGVVGTITNVTSTTITVTTPAHAAGLVNVSVTNANGTTTSFNAYTYINLSPGVITSITPNSGSTAGGQTVTIGGSNLGGTTSVSFGTNPGATPGTIISISDTGVVVMTPAHTAGTVNVNVTSPTGTVQTAYTYVDPAAILSLTPNLGSTSGGTSVTISGSNFTGTTAVTFGGVAVTSISSITANSLTVTTGAHGEGLVNVVITTPAGTTTTNNAYTYVQPATITQVSPTVGTTSGGTTVTITGTNLSGSSVVKFGNTNATSINSVSQTSVVVTTPSHGAGLVDVTVTTPAGDITAPGAFTFIAPASISSLSPIVGSTTGGTSVTISGSNLSGTSSVVFGGSVATITNVTASSVTVTTSSHLAGLVNVVLTTPAGSVTSTGAYTYVAPATISSLTPNAGSSGGGTSVTIAGTNLSGTSSVKFDGLTATLGSITPTSVTVTTPAHAVGAVNVSVTTGGGTVTANGAYTYLTLGSCKATVPILGLQVLTCLGTNLTLLNQTFLKVNAGAGCGVSPQIVSIPLSLLGIGTSVNLGGNLIGCNINLCSNGTCNIAGITTNGVDVTSILGTIP